MFAICNVVYPNKVAARPRTYFILTKTLLILLLFQLTTHAVALIETLSSKAALSFLIFLKLQIQLKY